MNGDQLLGLLLLIAGGIALAFMILLLVPVARRRRLAVLRTWRLWADHVHRALPRLRRLAGVCAREQITLTVGDKYISYGKEANYTIVTDTGSTYGADGSGMYGQLRVGGTYRCTVPLFIHQLGSCRLLAGGPGEQYTIVR